MSLDLTPHTQESHANVLSVEGLNRQIRSLIEGEIGVVWVRGEISNFKAHTSGHYYFSLKDSQSQVRAVMFRGHNSRLKFKPIDGHEVIIRGKVSVYEPRGEYQIVCDMMEQVGAGALQRAFEELKAKLKSEGLFEAARKRKLPAHPRHVAIVSSPTGAAIQDMLNVLGRRNKTVKITLVPTLVQGEGAALQIVQALKMAFQLNDVDAIIVGRGGGSIEDLWAFNDEQLARTIASSPVPVISAVGHEVDFTIADFVADVRAPTPSAAAELVAQSSEDIITKIQSTTQMLKLVMNRFLQSHQQGLKTLSAQLIDPKRRLQDLMIRNDEFHLRLHNAIQGLLAKKLLQVHLAQEKLGTPESLIMQKQNRMQSTIDRMNFLMSRKLDRMKSQMVQAVSMLDSLSPLKVVTRGYSLVYKEVDLVKSIRQLKKNDEIKIILMEGQAIARIQELKSEETIWTSKKD